MSTLLRFLLLFLSVLFKVNAGTHQLQQPGIIYADGHTANDFTTGPKSAKHQISSQNFVEFNNNNQPNYYQNQNFHQGKNQNARIIVQSNGAPTIQTVYESSSSSPAVNYQQTSSESSNQHSSTDSQKSSSTTAATHTQFIQPQAVIINGNQGYMHNQNGNQGYVHNQNGNQGYVYNQNGIAQASLGNSFTVHQNNPTVIQSTTVNPGYQTATSSSENSFESSSQSSSSSSTKSSSQFNTQTTAANPIYQPQIVYVTTPAPQPQLVHVTTPYSAPFENNPHGSIDGSNKYLPPMQTNHQFSTTPATTIQTFESSTQSSSDQQSNSKSSTQSNQKTTIVSTTVAPDISQSNLISMSVTPTPYTISVTPHQTYDISHSPVPITPITPVHQPIPIQPVYKPIVQPAPFAVPVIHHSVPPIIHNVPTTQPLHITPHTPVVNHIPQPKPAIHHVPVVTEIPVTEVQEHHGLIEKTINVPEPGIKTQTFEIRRPAIQKQFYDIEERVIVRPAGSVVVEIDQPLSKTAKGGEVIIPIGEGHGVSESHSNEGGHTQGTSQIHNSGTVNTESQGHGITVGSNSGIYTHGISQGHNNEGVYTGNQGHSITVGHNTGIYTHGISQSHNTEGVYTGNQGHGISPHNNGIYTHEISQGHNNEGVYTGNQGHGITVGHNTGIYTHGISQGHNNQGVYTGNQGHQHVITTGGNNYQHLIGTFGYYPYPNFCDQVNKFSTGPAVSVNNPGIAHTDQQYQPSSQAITSTTINPILSTTSAPLNLDDDDTVVINAKHQQPSEKYIDSTTQPSQFFSTTTPAPFIQNTIQQSGQTGNTNNRPMPHMLTVGDPDFQSPPFVEIRPKSESANQINNNYLHNQPAVRGDLHNAGAHTLYTMQSVMNDEYLNQQQNQQPNQQQNHPAYQQQVNFNQQEQSVSKNNSSPFIVYAITARNPNNYVAPQQRQLVFPQQNVGYTRQQQPGYYNDAYTQETNQLPQQYTTQQNAPYIIAGNQHGISHSPLAYSSSYYNQRIPNTPINGHFSTYNQSPPGYIHYSQNNPNGANTRLYTGPAVFPKQEYEKESAAYTQPQNFVNYQQQSPSQQIIYTQNPTFPHQLPAQNIVYNNNNNQSQEILGNQGQEFQAQNPQQFTSQNNNTQYNSQLNQASPIQISFNESDSYPIINIRNDINNKQYSNTSQPIQIAQYNNNYTGFNVNLNENKNPDYSNNPTNIRVGGDISPQQQDSQPQSSLITGKYENGPSVNVNFQPNQNQDKLLDLILSNKGSTGINDNYDDLTLKSHIISATPAPKFSEPSGERVHTRRIVVNQPLETVQTVQEQIPVTNYKQVTIQQPTVYKTSRVGLKRVESSVPVFYQPQNSPVHYNNQHQPVSYSFVHRN